MTDIRKLAEKFYYSRIVDNSPEDQISFIGKLLDALSESQIAGLEETSQNLNTPLRAGGGEMRQQQPEEKRIPHDYTGYGTSQAWYKKRLADLADFTRDMEAEQGQTDGKEGAK